MNEFDVIDPETGEYPDLAKIAEKEWWAKDLMFMDMDQFAIAEDGSLLLLDDCSRYAYVPADRFQVRREEAEMEQPLTFDELRQMDGRPVYIVIAGIESLEMWGLVEAGENHIYLTNNLGGRTGYVSDYELRKDGVKVYRHERKRKRTEVRSRTGEENP